jgi:hypothetical protein
MNKEPNAVMNYVTEPATMPIGDAAKAVEIADRRDIVVGAIGERLLDIATDPNATQRDGAAALRMYGNLDTQITVGTPETDQDPIGLEASTVWNELTPERQKYAQGFAEAVSAMPLFQERGLVPTDFRVVKTGEVENPTYTVMYAATNRLVLGDPKQTFDPARSWSGIKGGKPNEAMEFDVNGIVIDVRSAQTYDRLAAVSKENPEINEWVWRSGESQLADGNVAPAFSLLDGQADGYVVHRDNDDDGLGFRPAVDLP